MPAKSQAQRAWSWTKAGKKALGDSAKDFEHTPGKLPAKAPKPKGKR